MESNSHSLFFDQPAVKSIAIRILLVFLLILILPFGIGEIFQTPGEIHFQDIFRLSTYLPNFIAVPEWGWQSFANIWLALATAILIGSAWYFISGNTAKDRSLFYWLYVIARYRLALGIIGYGMIKLFPVQFPAPSLSDLNTAYGDFLPWKIYALTLGYASAGYEPVLGLLEIIGAILLLFRKTATFGAGLLLMFLINIVAANFAYQLGNHVYSIFLLLLTLIVLAPDLPKLYHLLVLRNPVKADSPFQLPNSNWIKSLRTALKLVFALFILFYGAYTFSGYERDNWPYPNNNKDQSLYGLYNVKEFRLNGTTHPFNHEDKIRWQDVVFEKWNSISIRKNTLAKTDLSIEKISFRDRKFEQQGNGGRTFYTYTIDTLKNEIQLKNETGSFHFHYQKAADASLHLSGTNELKDSLTLVLEPIQKKYLLNEGRRKTTQKF